MAGWGETKSTKLRLRIWVEEVRSRAAEMVYEWGRNGRRGKKNEEFHLHVELDEGERSCRSTAVYWVTSWREIWGNSCCVLEFRWARTSNRRRDTRYANRVAKLPRRKARTACCKISGARPNPNLPMCQRHTWGFEKP